MGILVIIINYYTEYKILYAYHDMPLSYYYRILKYYLLSRNIHMGPSILVLPLSFLTSICQYEEKHKVYDNRIFE